MVAEFRNLPDRGKKIARESAKVRSRPTLLLIVINRAVVREREPHNIRGYLLTGSRMSRAAKLPRRTYPRAIGFADGFDYA